MALTLTITDAGRAALVNAAHSGTNAVRIASVGVSGAGVAPLPTSTTLPGEYKRIATISGAAVASDIIHLVVRDESADAYPLDVDVYLQLRDAPADARPRICVGCGCSHWDPCGLPDDAGSCAWTNETTCTRCSGEAFPITVYQ